MSSLTWAVSSKLLTYTKLEVFANTSDASPDFVKTELLYISKRVYACHIWGICTMFLSLQLCVPIIDPSGLWFFLFILSFIFLQKSGSLQKWTQLRKDGMEMLKRWIMKQCQRNSDSQIGRNNERGRLWRRWNGWSWRRIEERGNRNSHSVAIDRNEQRGLYWKRRYTVERSVWGEDEEEDFFWKLLQCFPPTQPQISFPLWQITVQKGIYCRMLLPEREADVQSRLFRPLG